MFTFENKGARYRYDYQKLCDMLNEHGQKKNDTEAAKLLRYFIDHDIFFFLYFIVGIREINDPWLVERCYEVQDSRDRTLDLWAREHFKSTIITFAGTVQDILKTPESRICIFSHTRDIAKSFLRRIKVLFETNKLLQAVYPDVLYTNPQKQSPKWNEDDGLVVKRRGNYGEATLEAWGVTDGMPTGKHYTRRVYDDLVTEKSVSTPEQIRKTRECFQLSHSLAARGGNVSIVGTIYNFGDLYCELMKQSTWKSRVYPAEADGTPVYMTREELDQKREDQGSYVYSCQMLLNPVPRDDQRFEIGWMRYFADVHTRLNKYILVDPAGEKKKGSDYTVMMVIGVDSQRNYYVLDMVRDKLNLGERWEKMLGLVEKHAPIMTVGYEKYGKDSEIEYFKMMMVQTGKFFNILPIGGPEAKLDRIMSLIPLFEKGRVLFRKIIHYKNYLGELRNLTEDFVSEEYMTVPYSKHDDMMDCLARILDKKLNIVFPGVAAQISSQRAYSPLESGHSTWDWVSA